MTCSFALPYRLNSSRFVKVEEVVRGWWVHRLRINESNQLDEEIQSRLRESYRLMGMQERLDSTKAKLRRGSSERMGNKRGGTLNVPARAIQADSPSTR